jgi:hypothetical protein
VPRGWGGPGERIEFGGHICRLGGADPLEDLVCLAQADLGIGGSAGGQGAPAQASKRVGLIP